MTKKIFSIILAAALSLMCVTACGAAGTDNIQSHGNVLVTYFSATGNTEGIAQHISNILGADMYEIEPAVPYTSADLNYNSDCRANDEQNNPDARPEIAGKLEKIGDYDVIFVGYPIWWGKLPKIIYTFLESYDLSGKTIIPFCTSGSSGISASVSEIKSLEPNATVNDGRRFGGGSSEEIVKAWVDTLDLPEPSEKAEPQITFDGSVATVQNAPNGSTLIGAFYDDGKLIATQIEKGSQTITMDFSDKLPEADTVKAFLWDMETIRPLCPVTQIDGGKNMEDTPVQNYDTLYIHANGTTFEADFEDNTSAEAFIEKLKQGDVTVDMHDYENFEKVGSFGFSLPKNDTQITTEPGDLILYQGNQLTIHYGNNSWSYTRLGKVRNMTGAELKEKLGDGDVTVTLSLK